jgi:WhiB family redox-sensing transcriptional regulator
LTITDVTSDTKPTTDEEWHALLHNRIHNRNDTYCTYGCRCSCCRTAHTEYKKSYRPPSAVMIANTDTNWMKTTKKNCTGLNPEIFFTTAGEGTKSYEDAVCYAISICEGCCVKKPCLDYALATRQEGVWGGTDDKDRRRIKRLRREKRS